jgi:hypothetical protein
MIVLEQKKYNKDYKSKKTQYIKIFKNMKQTNFKMQTYWKEGKQIKFYIKISMKTIKY